MAFFVVVLTPKKGAGTTTGREALPLAYSPAAGAAHSVLKAAVRLFFASVVFSEGPDIGPLCGCRVYFITAGTAPQGVGAGPARAGIAARRYSGWGIGLHIGTLSEVGLNLNDRAVFEVTGRESQTPGHIALLGKRLHHSIGYQPSLPKGMPDIQRR